MDCLNSQNKRIKYKILAMGDKSCGKDNVLQQLREIDLTKMESESVNTSESDYLYNFIRIKIFDFEIGLSEENNKSENVIQDYLNSFQNLFNFAKGGIDLILIFFPLTVLRPDITYASQVYKLIGSDCYTNLIVVLTDYEKLNVNIRKETLDLNELQQVIMKNFMRVTKENILIFDPLNKKRFSDDILEKLSRLNKYEIPCVHSYFAKYEITKHHLRSLIGLIYKNEELFRFFNYHSSVISYLNKNSLRNFDEEIFPERSSDLAEKPSSGIFKPLKIFVAIPITVSAFYLIKYREYLFSSVFNFLRK